LRPEGDRLVFEGGGILRCRPDGRDLHVFATGLRNIYDVALDEDLNVFVRDNENDGGDYKVRVCHSFFGADHGYPYLYYERPDEALPPLADLGLGSSAGGLCYLETQFPAEYRGNLFFCEWGRAVMRYRPQRAGGGFAPVEEVRFAAAAENDPYGFKPTDLVVERDGSLIVADWGDGQKPKRGRGRIYRIRWDGSAGGSLRDPHAGSRRDPTSLLAHLDSESYYERVAAQEAIVSGGADSIAALRQAVAQPGRLGVRGRLHAIWILAREEESSSQELLFTLAQRDPDSRVRAQAIRALADELHDRGDGSVAKRLSLLVRDNDPRLLLEVIVAVGRLRWPDVPHWLQSVLSDSADPAIQHAAMHALRRCENWPAVLQLLDLPATDPVRTIALRAIADQAVPKVVDGLISRLADNEAVRRREYADALTRVHKQPGPWTYWGYRPPPRPVNTVAWERTTAIQEALNGMLADPDRAVRLAVLRRMQREKIPVELVTLGRWLTTERSPEHVAAILDSLPDHALDERRPLLERVILDAAHASPNRLAALGVLAADASESNASRLFELAQRVEEDAVLAALLGELQQRRVLTAVPMFKRLLRSSHPDVRAQAADALGALDVSEASAEIEKLLDDAEAAVRRAAATAMGPLKVRSSTDRLLQLAADADALVRQASLESLRRLGEPRAVPLAVAALSDRQTQAAALACIGELGNPDNAEAVIELAHRDPSAEVVSATVRLLADWAGRPVLPSERQAVLEQAIAELQGNSGMLVYWRASDPLEEPTASQLVEHLTSPGSSPAWRSVFATGLEQRVRVGGSLRDPATLLAYTNLTVTEPAAVQFLASSNSKFRVWLNGKQVYDRAESGRFQSDSDRFDAALEAGRNRIVVQLDATNSAAEFHVRFRRKSSTAGLEQLVQAALARPGNAERGRTLFFDQAKTQCSKCHRIGDQGERIGPELTGLGDRFARIHIVESILEPSRTVAPGFQTQAVVLRDGRLVAGIKVVESAETITLADNQGKQHTLSRAEIEQEVAQSQSTMPDGLTKLLSANEFVDLVAFLASQKRSVSQ
ncbi:MAG: HEAT repeat domain-containing protein, partial [Planctomycetes bacterium]|nr:HEAT repeat domain-containing protein [Planctomycetota bacterium]